MILSFERFRARDADVLALVAVCQLVFGERRRVAEDLVAYLKQKKHINGILLWDICTLSINSF